MAGKRWSAGSIAAAVVGALALAAVVFIMVNGLGLNPDLDFGAGAYYYADIPDYQKTLNWDTYTARLPFVIYLLLFLLSFDGCNPRGGSGHLVEIEQPRVEDKVKVDVAVVAFVDHSLGIQGPDYSLQGTKLLRRNL